MGTAARHDPLHRYREKRNFHITSEPDGAPVKTRAPRGQRAPARGKRPSAHEATEAPEGQALAFVIQKHWASHLHYDFRLELGGVLLSWAVPKGPSFDPKQRRMAVQVEDHPLDYGGFEGSIPAGQYGAGDVIVWDQGRWTPVGDPEAGLRDGKLVFQLHGQKLAGLWQLVRTSKGGEKRQQWLLIKKHDAWERPHDEFDVTLALPDSVVAKPLGLLEEREPHEAPAGDASAPAAAGRSDAASDAASDPSLPDLSRARKAALPATLSPQLATLVTAPPPGDWVAEAKFDGYRLMTRIAKGKVQLLTRGGNDWSDRMPTLVEALKALPVDSAWLDGEIVVLGPHGSPDFNRLQNAVGRSATRAGAGPGEREIVYFLFDMPFLQGHDLREVPLRDRRGGLRALLHGHPDEHLRFSEDFNAPPERMLAAACQLKLEGLILKRPDARYVSARSDSWVKLKCQQRQEFVVVGFTPRSDAPKGVGSLLLGVRDGRQWRYAGRVGTGWSMAQGDQLRRQLDRLEIQRPHFSAEDIQRSHWARRASGDEHWVRPEMVVEVAFAEWTPDGHIRHASFQGVREDKPAAQIKRESAKEASDVNATGTRARKRADGKPPVKQVQAALAGEGPSSAPAPAQRSAAKTQSADAADAAVAEAAPPAARSARRGDQLRITHPERVIDPDSGLTKIDLVRYYESVAEWIQPHLADRPVALVRAPDGVGGQHFFQKHEAGDALIVIDTIADLLRFTQLNAIEFHTWNSRIDKLDRPDRLVFDLDPGTGVTWPQMREAAQLVHGLLEELGLKSWLKTSGGKGLHVVVPLTRRADHDRCKAFSRLVVEHLAATLPKRFSAKSGPRNRVGKMFVDYLRNGEGQTTAAAFSARARPGLGVSMPVHWDQLKDIKRGDQWTVGHARDHLSFLRDDPWKDYWTHRQTLTAALKRLEP